MKKLKGTIHDDKALFLRLHVGEANSEDGDKYEMSTNVADQSPIIHSKKSGQWFTLSWADIINMAVELGIDEK